jgi:hypothetical protein
MRRTPSGGGRSRLNDDPPQKSEPSPQPPRLHPPRNPNNPQPLPRKWLRSVKIRKTHFPPPQNHRVPRPSPRRLPARSGQHAPATPAKTLRPSDRTPDPMEAIDGAAQAIFKQKQ